MHTSAPPRAGRLDLIETLWNVKLNEIKLTRVINEDLIETLWNVKLVFDDSLSYLEWI